MLVDVLHRVAANLGNDVHREEGHPAPCGAAPLSCAFRASKQLSTAFLTVSRRITWRLFFRTSIGHCPDLSVAGAPAPAALASAIDTSGQRPRPISLRLP